MWVHNGRSRAPFDEHPSLRGRSTSFRKGNTMSRNLSLAGLAATVMAAASLTANAALGAGGSGPVQAPATAGHAAPTCGVVTRTIMVPQTTYKTISVSDVEMRPVTRTRTVPVTRLVPETQTVMRLVTIEVPVQRTRTE